MAQRSRYFLIGFFAMFTTILLTFYYLRSPNAVRRPAITGGATTSSEVIGTSTTGSQIESTTIGEIYDDDGEDTSWETPTSEEVESTTGPQEKPATTGTTGTGTTGTTGTVTTGTTGSATTGVPEEIKEPATRHFPIRPPRKEKFMSWYYNMIANASKAENSRVLIVPAATSWGLGNTYYGFLTMLLYTVLTDRVLFLEDTHPVGKVFDLPWDWKWNAEKSAKYNKEVVKKDYVNGCFWDEDSMAQKWSKDTQFEDWLTYNPNTQIPAFITNCPGFRWIARNPRFTDKLKTLGIVPSDAPVEDYAFHAVGFLSRMFLQNYTTEYKTDVDSFMKDWEAKKAVVIGMQMRTGKREGDGRFLTDQQIDFMFGCADKLVKKFDNTTVLLTTDYEPLFHKARQMWPGKLVEVSGALGHVSKNGGDVFHRSALEMLLLSKTDHMFFTAASTYGASAAILGYMAPLWVTFDNPMKCDEAPLSRGPGGVVLRNSVVW